MKINFCNVYTQDKALLEVDDDLTVSDLKILYSDNLKNKVPPNLIRMFFGGAELIDDNFIYQHEIKSGYTVNVMNRVAQKD